MIEPYHKYPNLLDILFNFLKTEHTRGLRREVIRVLGLLGALDPYKHTQHQRNEKRSKMGTPISKPMDKKTQGTGMLLNLFTCNTVLCTRPWNIPPPLSHLLAPSSPLPPLLTPPSLPSPLHPLLPSPSPPLITPSSPPSSSPPPLPHHPSSSPPLPSSPLLPSLITPPPPLPPVPFWH